MTHAVYELVTVKPHLGRTPSFTDETWRIYCDGYYTALARALQVMQLVEQRYETWRKERRRVAADQRAAGAPSVEPVQHHVREIVRMRRDEFGQAVAQRRDGDQWQAEFHTVLRHGIHHGDIERAAVGLEVKKTRDVAQDGGVAHAAHDNAERRSRKP